MVTTPRPPRLFLLANPEGHPCRLCGAVLPYLTTTRDADHPPAPEAHLPVAFEEGDGPVVAHYPLVPVTALLPPARWERVANLTERGRQARASHVGRPAADDDGGWAGPFLPD